MRFAQTTAHLRLDRRTAANLKVDLSGTGTNTNALKVNVVSIPAGAPVSIGDGPNLDSFSRLRVSPPTTLFSFQNQYNLEPMQLEATNTSDGVAPAYSANTRMATLQVNAGATGGRSALQSYRYIPYQPGKSQFIFMTGVMGTATAGAVKRFGYGDAANGLFFEQSAAGVLQFNRRTSTSGSVADNVVTQPNWNLDKLDGTGASGLTLTPANCFILVIDFQYLGMGRIRFGFDINGLIVYAHQYLNANVLTVPYMQTGSLPVLAEITAAAGLGSTATANLKCASVISEGGVENIFGRMFSITGTGVTAAATRTFAFSIRPKLTFNSITNRIFFAPQNIEVLAGANSVLWELCVGVTLSGSPPTFADANTGHSGFEVGTGGTYSSLSSGIVVASGIVGTGGGSSRTAVVEQVSFDFPITLNAAGANRDLGTMTLLLTSLTSTSNCAFSFDWVEVR